jgi:hypothetical protein
VATRSRSVKSARNGSAGPERQWRFFLKRYDPPIARQAAEERARLRGLLPGAFEIVYDNYNALVLAFGASEKPADIICSIALYPKWVTLFFSSPTGEDSRIPRACSRGAGPGSAASGSSAAAP